MSGFKVFKERVQNVEEKVMMTYEGHPEINEGWWELTSISWTVTRSVLKLYSSTVWSYLHIRYKTERHSVTSYSVTFVYNAKYHVLWRILDKNNHGAKFSNGSENNITVGYLVHVGDGHFPNLHHFSQWGIKIFYSNILLLSRKINFG